MPSMIVHDRRLKGATPTWYTFVMQVTATTGIRHIVSTVARRARERRKLDRLHILCHGFEANWNLSDSSCVADAHGGFGLQLGREGLTLFNVRQVAQWQGLVDLIVLFACATADTYAPNRGTWGDGRRFCGELALWSGARVIAARDTQTYHCWDDGSQPIDFGAWEGPVYEFSPADPEGTRVLDPSPYRVQRDRASAA
ncbi:hypothetical protein FK498_13120 [Elioraea sp. Yellowstone]|jgi:hypothetical protein|uniref:hypothetical protein n=1 Tax=Elioraea sp. Yellowstone TaxID=2592070 RepID=UPI0011540791|nr:hypothetical protein [Elioraea sp. Yellowstone]TQF77333.1 hypothetical protein FK498_13120 [Elioraea sp. Yellowstone]